jgi:N-acetylmuramoyl-L-alanine amidase
MSKRVFIGVGHGGKDPGACANSLREADVALTVALSMRDELVRHGITVGISRTTDEDDKLAQEIRECEAFAPDLAVEVHFNAGGGVGAEIFIQSGSSKSALLGSCILKRITALGQKSRGLKTNSRLGWTRQVSAPAVLVEGAFLDSANYTFVNTAEKQRHFGIAYAWGVLDYLGIEIIKEDETVTDEQFDALMARWIARQEEQAVSDYAKDAWERAKKDGITDGSAPRRPCTRQEAIVFLERSGR